MIASTLARRRIIIPSRFLHRSLSVETPDAKQQADGSTGENSKGSNDGNNDDKVVMPTTIIPWRHEPQPLQRIVTGTVENVTENQLLTTTEMKPGNPTVNALATAYMFLDTPLLQMLFFGSWKEELAESVSYAFIHGVSNILAMQYGVPSESIVKDERSLKFESTIGGKEAESEESKENSISDIESMLEPNLISLFKRPTIDGDLDKEIMVSLQTEVLSSELVSLYSIPYISRRNVAKDSLLKEFYQKMLAKPSMERTPDLNLLRTERLLKGTMESTVIAQVLVWCKEQFHVTDRKSGETLQGKSPSEDENESLSIPHLVRMEMTVETQKLNNGQFRNVQSDWIITDIDDLAGGNLIL